MVSQFRGLLYVLTDGSHTRSINLPDIGNRLDPHLALGGNLAAFVQLVNQVYDIFNDNPLEVGYSINNILELLIGIHVDNDFARIMRSPDTDQVNIANTGVLLGNDGRDFRQVSRLMIEHKLQTLGDFPCASFDFHSYILS